MREGKVIGFELHGTAERLYCIYLRQFSAGDRDCMLLPEPFAHLFHPMAFIGLRHASLHDGDMAAPFFVYHG